MNDLISKSKLKNDIIANLPQGMIKVAFLDLVDSQPTVDDKEIIRKPMERILERLKGIVVQRVAWFGKKDEICIGVDKAIKICKEEGGIE